MPMIDQPLPPVNRACRWKGRGLVEYCSSAEDLPPQIQSQPLSVESRNRLESWRVPAVCSAQRLAAERT